MFNETNPYLKKQEMLRKARDAWAYSEWFLNFLRTQGAEKPKQPNDDEVILWHQSLAKRNH